MSHNFFIICANSLYCLRETNKYDKTTSHFDILIQIVLSLSGSPLQLTIIFVYIVKMTSLTISTVVKSDYNTVSDLYENYLLSEGNIATKQEYALKFQEELAKHNTAEESVLYPAFEQYLGSEGKKIADQDRKELQTVKQLLSQLVSISVSDPQHCVIFDKLMTKLNEHVKREETNDLPKFENAKTPDLSASLAYSFRQAKLSIPV
ncbi:unnamed protein product [Rotaria sordida]|uniref:Hemerythrin-like domain-containing protein n=1 Tax=Rotaria sordida TaxID=392033 RepID=A0A816CSR4_9BILA|nr:unnamed protein product [Rotaria sordida]CAF1627538.1 unnamed protein product [Rotaria sordida]